MRAKVDPEKCVACGICVDICPEVFKIEENTAIVHTDPVPDHAVDECKRAEEACGPEAITTEE